MRTLIIDDEEHCREGLAILLSKYCPEVEVVAQCPDATAALEAIEKFHPDLIFLDIEMPDMNGFEMLEHCREHHFNIIFATAYNEYAIQAIRHSALDYLLKPVTRNELVQAVARAQASSEAAVPARISQLLELTDSRKAAGKIALPMIDGFILVELKDILYCESENNYTRFHLVNGKTIFISKTLKKVEELLMIDSNFQRIHHSFVVNMKYVQRYFRGDGGEINLTTGKNLPVSRTKKQEFLDRLEKL